MQWMALLIIILPIGIFIYMKHKKGKDGDNSVLISGKRKKQESEAWVTIKKYLKDKNETGKEIVELFVVKRIDDTDVASLPTKELRKKQKEENKKKKQDLKALKNKDPKKYKEAKKAEKERKPEVWLLYFVTRNPKTKNNDNARIIECTIEYKKISKKETDRIIHVNDKINFKKEMEWIKPIKDKEDLIRQRNEAIEAKRAKKQADKKAKKDKKQADKKKAKKESK